MNTFPTLDPLPFTTGFSMPDPQQERINHLETENAKLLKALKAMEGGITLQTAPPTPHTPKEPIKLITAQGKVTRIRDLRIRITQP